MIGSKRRIKGVFDLLEKEKGLNRSKFERIYAPIGLDVGAESPEEIAVGIIAEIINVYRGGRAISLSDALRADRRLPLHPARVQ
jgi:xanthine dehydrogenase accessory factor